jgi:hypothetical protein
MIRSISKDEMLYSSTIKFKAYKQNQHPPTSKIGIGSARPSDLMVLRCQFPDGSKINHIYHKDEPLESIVNQVRFDMNYSGDVDLVVHPNIHIAFPLNNTIYSSGIKNCDLVLIMKSL